MTDQTYHLLCPKCGYDRWSEDGFQECPKCENKDLLLSPEERSQVIQRDTSLWCPTKGEFLDQVGEVIAHAQLAKLQRLGWKSPEDINHWLEERGAIYPVKHIAQAQLEADQKVLEETKIEIFLEFRNLLLEHCPEAAVSDWLADFSAKHFQIPKLLRSVDGETPAASSQTYTTSKKIIKETGQTKSKWRVNEWHVVEG